MATTCQQIHNRAISIIDELSDTGTIDAVKTKEYGYRAPFLLDMWQKEMVKDGKYYKSYELSCMKKTNLLGDNFEILENTGTAQVYTATGAYSFYIEVDGDCTVTLQEGGVNVSGVYSFNGGAETAFTGAISVSVPTGTVGFLPLKGILTASGGVITMSVNGTYYFKHTSRALSIYKFATAAKVPDFGMWYKVSMPSDFSNRSQVVEEYPTQQSVPTTKWENNKDLYVFYDYTGIVRINYIPVPTEITSLTQTLEIDDITAQSGAYYLAEHFAMADQNDTLAKVCRDKFLSLKIEAMQPRPLSNEAIIDVYGG